MKDDLTTDRAVRTSHVRKRLTIISFFIFISTVALCFPFIRMITWFGDEGVLLQGAARIIDGQKIYEDFFEFLPPAGFALTALWFKLFGASFLSARIMGILCISVISTSTFLVSYRASRQAGLSAVLAILWVTMSQGMWTVVNHHYFTTMFAMIAFLTSLSSPGRSSRTSVLAGLAAGSAMMTTPTRGALTLLASAASILFSRPVLPRLFWLAIGVSSIAVMTTFYLLLASSVPDAIRDMILFPFYGYNNASLQKVAFGNWSEIRNFPFIPMFLISPILVGCLIILYRQKILADHALATCGFFFVAATVGCYPRPDIVHIAFNAPLAIPLFALCIARLTCRWPALLRRSVPALLILLASPSLLAFLVYTKSVLPDPVITSPRGAVALHGLQGAQDALARIDALPKSDKIFLYSYMPMMSFLTGRLQSVSLDIFVPYYTTPGQYRLTCDEMAHVNWAVIQRMSMENWKQSFPLMSLGAPTEFLRFEEALDEGFDLTDTVGGYEFRRRNGKDITAACAKIGGNAF